jgi:hypothetical protein
VPGEKYIIGYYPSWAAGRNVFVKDLPASKLTHINYAFSNVSASGECILGDPAADVEQVYSATESVNGRNDSKSAALHGNFHQLLELKQSYPHLKVLISIGGWSWSGNFSAEAWAGWTAEGLYFAFQVKDDIHVQPKADSDLWHGDHIELQFDTLLDKDYTNPGMNDDDYQIGLSLGDFDKVPPVAYAWFNGPGAPGELNTIQLAYTVTEDGYILEVFIPKDALVGITLAEGATFGMNISPSDADDAAQGQKVMLSTSAIRTYADPKTFGKITLVK